MKLNHLFPAFLITSLSQAPTDATDVFQASRNPFAGTISDPQDIPQFIHITFDDAVSPYAASLVKKLFNVRDSRGCGPKATFYISITDTLCEYVQSLRKGQHEIATHTYNHVGTPGLEEIQTAITYLNETCGVPKEELVGFRAPYLQYDETTMDYLKQAGILYDSTVSPTDAVDANYGINETWPFTFEQSSIDEFECSPNCPTFNVNSGLWEIPMYPLYNDATTPNILMDYVSTDLESFFEDNFYRHYNGNRAPLGLFFHPGWLESDTYADALVAFMEKILTAHNDVYFATNQEMLAWMNNPVPKDSYQYSCEGQVMDCLPYDVYGCVYGTWNPDTCSCDCDSPWCLDSNGQCTTTTCDSSTSDSGTSDTSSSSNSLDSCCDADGYKPIDDCSSYIYCQSGAVLQTFDCTSGTKYDSSLGFCNWEASVTCSATCMSSPTTAVPSAAPSTSFPSAAPSTSFPSAAPSTSFPSAEPSAGPVGTPTTPEPSAVPSLVPTATPSSPPSSTPVGSSSGTSNCCEGGVTGWFAIGDCTQFVQCVAGTEYVGNCNSGLVFDDALLICNWPTAGVTCQGTCTSETA